MASELERRSGGNLRQMAIVIVWMLGICIAAAVDRPVAMEMRSLGVENFLHTHSALQKTLKSPGEYPFTVVVAIVIAFTHRRKIQAGIFMLLATAISGVNGVIKWMVGRTRPFKLHDDLAEPFVLSPFRGGVHGLFDSRNLCFPSGHAALAFATAAAMAILFPRGRWAFYAVAVIVAMERIAENAHWCSDTVGAAALGIGGVQLIRWIWWRRVTP
jgi:membrane-associated phospholipid phosphatase